MEQQKRSYSLEEAAKELNIAPETITRVMEKAGMQHTGRNEDTLSEDDVNRLLTILQGDQDFASSVQAKA